MWCCWCDTGMSSARSSHIVFPSRENGRNVTSFGGGSPLWLTAWVDHELGGSALHQCRWAVVVWVVRCCDGVMSCCWLCLSLHLPVVSRETDLVEGKRHYFFEKRSVELSWCQIGLLTQSLQRRHSRRACVRAYVHVVCVCVYMCMYVGVQTCKYVYICICIFMDKRMHVYACVHLCSCTFVHRFWVSVAVLQRVWTVS